MRLLNNGRPATDRGLRDGVYPLRPPSLNNEDLTVYGTGTQSRCFTHVLDTVPALVLVLDSDEASGHVYNDGSRTPVPIIELAGKVIERVGSNSKITLVPYEDDYGHGFEELGRRVPDTSALTEFTDWRPSRNVEEMIDDVIAYEQNQARGTGGQEIRDHLRVAGWLETRPERGFLTVFIVSYLVVLAATPLAIRVARSTGFLDRPRGYRTRANPTPCLGGAAVLMGFLAAAPGRRGDRRRPVCGAVRRCRLALASRNNQRLGRAGSVDSVLAEAAVAVLLWKSGLGWSIFEGEVVTWC